MRIAIKQNPEAEVPTEILADSIVAIASGLRKLRAGRLNDRALLLLVQDAANPKVSQRDILAVFDGIDRLESRFIRKVTKIEKSK